MARATIIPYHSKVTSDLFEPPRMSNVPVPGSADRKFYLVERIPLGYTGPHPHVEVAEVDATLVASETRRGMHAPAIDLDVPAYLLPSSTPGHSHLYIDVEMPWWKYRLLLWALTFVGIVEKGYYYHSVRRRASFLRRPGVKKEVKHDNT